MVRTVYLRAHHVYVDVFKRFERVITLGNSTNHIWLRQVLSVLQRVWYELRSIWVVVLKLFWEIRQNVMKNCEKMDTKTNFSWTMILSCIYPCNDSRKTSDVLPYGTKWTPKSETVLKDDEYTAYVRTCEKYVDYVSDDWSSEAFLRNT